MISPLVSRRLMTLPVSPNLPRFPSRYVNLVFASRETRLKSRLVTRRSDNALLESRLGRLESRLATRDSRGASIERLIATRKSRLARQDSRRARNETGSTKSLLSDAIFPQTMATNCFSIYFSF